MYVQPVDVVTVPAQGMQRWRSHRLYMFPFFAPTHVACACAAWLPHAPAHSTRARSCKCPATLTIAASMGDAHGDGARRWNGKRVGHAAKRHRASRTQDAGAQSARSRVLHCIVQHLVVRFILQAPEMMPHEPVPADISASIRYCGPVLPLTSVRPVSPGVRVPPHSIVSPPFASWFLYGYKRGCSLQT